MAEPKEIKPQGLTGVTNTPESNSTAIGLLKAVTNVTDKINPDRNKLETKSATIGIRG